MPTPAHTIGWLGLVLLLGSYVHAGARRATLLVDGACASAALPVLHAFCRGWGNQRGAHPGASVGSDPSPGQSRNDRERERQRDRSTEPAHLAVNLPPGT
jgi:hypothetical protein